MELRNIMCMPGWWYAKTAHKSTNPELDTYCLTTGGLSLLQSSKWNNAPWHQKYYGRIIVGAKNGKKIAIMKDTKVALFVRWEEIWYK